MLLIKNPLCLDTVFADMVTKALVKYNGTYIEAKNTPITVITPIDIYIIVEYFFKYIYIMVSKATVSSIIIILMNIMQRLSNRYFFKYVTPPNS